MLDFRSARIWAQELVEQALCEGSVAVDATMGNGNDTQWLCQRVGESGRVYAFDVQAEAVAHTDARLREAGLRERATLYCRSHEELGELVPEPADAVMFNLGWLPGAEHIVTTQVGSTLRAVAAALDRLKSGGVLTVCVYPGHEEGAREREALLAWAAALDARRYDVIYKTFLNQPKNPPCLLAVQKRPGRG